MIEVVYTLFICEDNSLGLSKGKVDDVSVSSIPHVRITLHFLRSNPVREEEQNLLSEKVCHK